MSCTEKKKNQQKHKQQVSGEHIRHFLHRMCNYVVSCCSRAKQRNKKKCTKSCTASVKYFFCLLDLLIFLPSSLPSPFSITRFYFNIMLFA